MKKKNDIKKKTSNVGLSRPSQSTQKNIPIRDIISGVIITKDNRYVKIIEVLPTTFLLKTVNEKNMIAEAFKGLIKIAPNSLQITSMTFPADLSNEIELLEKDIEQEEDDNCREIDLEYKQKLIDAQYYGIRRRFFISFEYEGANSILKKAELEDILYWMHNMSERIINALGRCTNEIVPDDITNINHHTAEILYSILNRKKSKTISFDEHIEEIYKRYLAAVNKQNFYIPPTDYLAPQNISYMNNRYIIIDGMYYSFLYIPSNGYDTYEIAGWLNIFVNSLSGVDVNIYLNRYPKEKIIGTIRRNLSYSEVSSYDSSTTSSAYDTANEKLESGYYLKQGLSLGEDFHYISILLTISSESLEEVDKNIEELKQLAIQNNLKLKECRFEEEQAFLSSLPLAKLNKNLFEKSKRNVLSEGAATTYPFTSFELNDPNGIYIGNNLNNGSLVLLNIFNTKRLQNANVFICGQSGAGKTYSLLLMAMRMRIKHIPVFIIAPEKEHEFRRVCDAIGGQFIQLGAGSPTRINIMEISKKDELALKNNDLIDGKHEKISYLAEKVQTLKSFFQLLATDMSIEEKQLLDEAIVRVYNHFGITNDNESLFTDSSHKKYKTMPIISDLQDELKKNQATVRLANIIGMLTTGSGESFNGHTNVDLNNEFTVIGLEHLNGEMLPLGIYMAMEHVWSKIKQDRTKKKALFIDEYWKLAFHPVAAAYSLEIAKTVRAYSASLILATQQITDMMAVENGKFGAGVLNNCKTKILLGMEHKDAETVQQILNLTPTETASIERFERGEALLVAGENRIELKFIAGKKEHDLITTDRSDLERLSREKQEMLRQQQLDNMVNIGGKFSRKEMIDKSVEMINARELIKNKTLFEGETKS